MSIRDLINQFTIHGAFEIKQWSDEVQSYIILDEGSDFECDKKDIKEEILDAEITYMYALDGMLNIEVKGDEEYE